MYIEDACIVPIDFTAESLSREIKELRPTVYVQGNAFCCLLGADPQTGIFACGDTIETALAAWQDALVEYMKKALEDDELRNYVSDSLTASNREVW